MKLVSGALALAFLVSVTTAPADTSSEDLIKALETWDAHALQVMAEQASDIHRQALARAVLKAFAGQDAVAIDSLDALIASPQFDDALLRFVALDELGRLHLRNQHYVPAARAFEGALALSASVQPGKTDDLKDDLNYARAFAAVPPMTAALKSAESTPLTRDSMDLSRASASINGHRVDAILDTGATNSVVSASTAKRLHLRVVRFKGGVASGGIAQVSSQFAVADRLLFAGYEFRNVPFFVLPDEAVTVPLGDGVVGKFEPMIGLSVLRKLGRLEFVQRDGRESLRVGGTSIPGKLANILLPEGMPIVLVRVEPQGADLRVSLDTGANRSSFAPVAISAFPALANGATQGRTSQAGAGGVLPNEEGTLIAQVTLQIGDQATALTRIPVSPGPDNCDGTLGQDVFRSGGGYVIDFDRMTLEILSSPPAPHSAGAQ